MPELILAINAGSSSLKFQLIRMPEEELVTKGLVEKIELKDSILTIKIDGEKVKTAQDIKGHAEVVDIMLDAFRKHNIVNDINDIDRTDHHVVHGGEEFPESAAIADEVGKEIEELDELASLHNPANLMGTRASRKLLPDIPHVAIFDTAFHQTMPEKAYLYSLPYRYHKDYGTRKYGFRGTSHKFVSQRAAEMSGKLIEDLRIISCHIGNGTSITAIDGGKSIDISTGFTPLTGITMGTHFGNIDPALVPPITKKAGKTAERVLEILNKEPGLLRLSGISDDLRDLSEEVGSGRARSRVALDVFTSKTYKYIGSYAVRIRGVDVIISTIGIGENSVETHTKILEGLGFMGVYWGPRKNEDLQRGKEGFINYPHPPVKIVVMPTDKESIIARDTVAYGGLKQFSNRY